jgi:hypothetical protein
MGDDSFLRAIPFVLDQRWAHILDSPLKPDRFEASSQSVCEPLIQVEVVGAGLACQCELDLKALKLDRQDASAPHD